MRARMASHVVWAALIAASWVRTLYYMQGSSRLDHINTEGAKLHGSDSEGTY
jgi:hypothetical protein